MTKQYAKLRELCEVISGSTPKTNVPEYWNGTLKWITPAEIGKECYVFDSERHISEEGAKSANLRPLPPGTVILSSRAPIGKTAIAGCELYCNQGFKNLICSSALVPEYLYYFLSYNTRRLNLLGRGATFKELSKSIVENIEIPLINLTQQKHIVHILQNIDRLIVKYSNAYSTLNKIVKSRFMEMFGDPVAKDHSINCSTLSSICKLKAGKFIKSSDILQNHFQETYPCFGGNGIRGYVTKYNNDGSFPIIGRQGALCGNVQFAKGKFYATEHAIVVTPSKAISSKWLYHVLLNLKLNRYATGAAQPGLSVEKLGQLTIDIPPLPLQQQFAAFVEKVDKSKLAVKQSLEKLETLKKSLMQQYFG